MFYASHEIRKMSMVIVNIHENSYIHLGKFNNTRVNNVHIYFSLTYISMSYKRERNRIHESKLK